MFDGLRSSSGVLRNPGKSYILQLVVDAIRNVNAQYDKNEISYSRKVMI
jgi:hypothetical protein